MPGILGPVLVLPLQERHWETGESPEEDQHDGYRVGENDTGRTVEELGFIP